MDATGEAFAYRCLPLNIANAHGWEVLSAVGFEAVWNGDTAPEAVSITLDAADAGPQSAPVAIFGQGVLTFHVEGILRTPPGWNLWVGGPPNRQKDAIVPLTGVIETDWSPFTFTMNWRFTRPHQAVRFEANEPFAFFFPLKRSDVEGFSPRFEALGADPATEARFKAWSQARDAFQQRMRTDPPTLPADRWQKHYYRGVDVAGEALVDDHRAKLRLKPFDRSAAPDVPVPPGDDAAFKARAPRAPDGPEVAQLRAALAKREWLLETLERQRDLAPRTVVLERRANLSSDEFLERYYAVNRPVILTGEMADWPALGSWTPDYLKAKVGPAQVEFQARRSSNPLFEMEKVLHREEAPFTEFMDKVSAGPGNDVYLTAYNSGSNGAALAPLYADLGRLDKFLDHGDGPGGMMWIGPAGTLTSLHHDLTNNFIAQVVGRKRILLLPASEVGKLYNTRHVFSEITDLEDRGLDVARFSRGARARVVPVVLEPGEILFTPLAWWHQVRALDFSVTVTYTNFRWPNGGGADYPAD
jgi:hypothetical protein